MLQEITKAEELRRRERKFSGIKEESLFNFSTVSEGFKIRTRYCIAVKKKRPTVWTVIELDKANIQRLINGEKPVLSTISFTAMNCLNVIKIEEA